MANVFQFGHAFGCSDDFSFAGAEGRSVLSDGFPADRATCTADDVARDATKFEEFKGGPIGNGVAELATPTCIREGREAFDVSRRGRRSFVVSFFVMVRWEVIKCLYCVASIRMKTNSIFCCAVKIF